MLKGRGAWLGLCWDGALSPSLAPTPFTPRTHVYRAWCSRTPPLRTLAPLPRAHATRTSRARNPCLVPVHNTHRAHTYAIVRAHMHSPRVHVHRVWWSRTLPIARSHSGFHTHVYRSWRPRKSLNARTQITYCSHANRRTIFYGHRVWIWKIIGSGAFRGSYNRNPIGLFYGNWINIEGILAVFSKILKHIGCTAPTT